MEEIRLHMCFMDEDGNLVEIPENIQKHIEAREEFWVDKIKAIDSKCGIVLERLELTEKALELACRTMLVPDGYCEDIECPNVTCKDCLVEHFKTRAREELKSE